LKNILKKYKQKLKSDAQNHLRKSDEVKMKSELKEKLLLEIEGLRVKNNKLGGFSKINNKSIINMVEEVKEKLSNL